MKKNNQIIFEIKKLLDKLVTAKTTKRVFFYKNKIENLLKTYGKRKND